MGSKKYPKPPPCAPPKLGDPRFLVSNERPVVSPGDQPNCETARSVARRASVLSESWPLSCKLRLLGVRVSGGCELLLTGPASVNGQLQKSSKQDRIWEPWQLRCELLCPSLSSGESWLLSDHGSSSGTEGVRRDAAYKVCLGQMLIKVNPSLPGPLNPPAFVRPKWEARMAEMSHSYSWALLCPETAISLQPFRLASGIPRAGAGV